MYSVSNSAEQTIEPGGTAVFNVVLQPSYGCAASFNTLLNSFRLNCNTVYDVSFGGNITGTEAGTPVELSIAVDGVAIPYSEMISTPSAANVFNSVFRTIPIINCREVNRITIVNSGTTAVTLGANPIFSVTPRSN